MLIEAAAILDQSSPAPPLEDKTMGVESKEGPSPTSDARSDDRVSSKLDILIKREAQAIARERAAKDQEKTIEEKLKRIADFEGAKNSPKKALELLGMNYDELTQSMLKDGEVPPEVEIRKLKEELAEFKKQTESTRQTDQEREQLEKKRQQETLEAQATNNFKGEINSYLDENKARYEYIAFEGSQALVYEVIDTHYNRSIDENTGKGKIMPIAEAADKVEHWLEKKELERQKLSKSQAFWKTSMVPKKLSEELSKQETKPSQTPKTLTNNLSATPQSPRKFPLTDDERVQKAIAYAKGLRP